jgi:hypothetical protein
MVLVYHDLLSPRWEEIHVQVIGERLDAFRGCYNPDE